MNLRNFVGALALGALMGLAVLAGGILAQNTSASAPLASNAAQTDQKAQVTQAATPGAQETAVPAPQQGTSPAPGGPGMGRGFGMRGHHAEGELGFGFGGPDFGFGGPGFGPGGHGKGMHGGQLTADSANRVISGTASLITLVKSDLAYANGKMDTAKVQDWISRADTLLKSAQSAVSSNQYERAIATAQAAHGLADAADTLMAQALGADNLPSYSQRPMKGRFGGNVTIPDATQAQASRMLAGFYNAILMKDAQLKASTSKGDADTYLSAAKDTYRTAYTAYGAGKYNDVRNSVKVGQMLLGVAESLLRAGSAPNDPNTPVQVPAPNF